MKVNDLVLGAFLTSLALVIPMAFGGVLGVVLPPFSATLAAHVPIMLSMLVNPLTAFVVSAGSALGFLIKLGPIVGARAFMHIFFAVTGAILIKRGFSFKVALLVALPIHAISEALVVIPFGFSLYDIGIVVGLGTALHHIADSFIAILLYGIIIKATGRNFAYNEKRVL